MSPELTALIKGLQFLVRMLAGRTRTTVDDAFADFLDLLLSNPAAAHAQLVAGKATAQAIQAAAPRAEAAAGPQAGTSAPSQAPAAAPSTPAPSTGRSRRET